MKKYFYDVESFPNFFCATFQDESGEDITQYSVGCGRDDLKSLLSFLNKESVLIGFNNISYDDPVLRFIQTWDKNGNLPDRIFRLSARLISDASRQDDDIRALRYPRSWDSKDGKFTWKSIDTLKIMAFDKLGIGLKQIAINLKHKLIQDLPYTYNHTLTEDEADIVLKYNINDVEITKKLYIAIKPQVDLRTEISKLYSVDVTNASDSKMGNIILEHFYKDELGADIKQLRDLRTKREFVNLKDCIPAVIQFSTPELISLKEKISATTVWPNNKFKFEEKIFFKGTKYSIGSGGIHSMESVCRFDSDDKKKIISADIASMYPTCIIINDIYPKHLGHDFVNILSTITAERVAAKKKNKVKADALKITINGLYGKLNSDTFWLEDAFAMLRVTIAGQLYILMLIEMLENSGVHCVSANTDGIECEVYNDKLQTYYDVCAEWEKITEFTLEYAIYKTYIKRDVNNYIAVDEHGKVKTKGAFISTVELKKGYKHPIIPLAVNEYFIKGIPVEETIRNCTDILDFCISQKSGKEFAMELKTVRGTELLQKTNRFYIANTGGALLKRKSSTRSVTGLFVGQNIRILNDYYSTTPFEDYDVDLDWYIREAKSRIEEIEPTVVQLTMFGAEIDYGKKVKMIAPSEKKKRPSPKKIKESDIREANKTRTRYEISQKYFLVTDVNTKWTPVVTLYNFESGTGNLKAKIKKPSFERKPLKVGDVVFAKELSEEPKLEKVGDTFVPVAGQTVWWLKAYALITDFSEFKLKEITE